MKKIDQDTELDYQALVLTDSFQTRFMPLTHVQPRCLLPLANVPLIEYTLEFLAQTDVVSEVFLMCSAHADQIQEYIDHSKWVLPSSPFTKIQTVLSMESRSVGDSVRDIDARGVITGDFILVSGDVITNMDLNKALSVHRQHKQDDRDYVSTMVLKQASPLHRSRSCVEPACFILEEGTNRCVYYQDIPPVDGKKTSVNIDPELLGEIGEFVVKNDLIDCRVDICTPQVLTTFQENFDYQFLRADWVKGVLGSDLLRKHIYTYITREDYAARVESWQTYDGISQDVLERWCYPIVPERNLLEDQTYSYESQHIYKEDNIRLSQSCKIESRVEIGSGTFVGDGSRVGASVIGRDCYIGNNVTIENSYIWSGARIEDGSVVKHSIVASGAVIRKNAVIKPGSVLGFGVIVGENVVVEEDTKIVKTPFKEKKRANEIPSDLNSEDETEDSSSQVTTTTNTTAEEEDEEGEDLEPTQPGKGDPSIVGPDGVGFVYEDDERYKGMVSQMAVLDLSDVSIASSTITHHSKRKKRTLSSATSQFLSEEEEEDFEKEAIATVDRAMENNHDMDTALLELNTLRMSMNVTYHEVRLATCTSLLKRVDHFIATETLGVKEATEKIFRKWSPLFRRQVFDAEDQVDLMMIIQEICNGLDLEYGAMVLLYVLLILYEEEVIDEDSIHVWWESEDSKAMDKVREKTSKWIEWLEQAESESESESGEDGDEE
ncbi:DEKNAAC105520 [Brettanomyces naardenensis]|uniref:Translation initiation factor eIF2B subunit epsilon n=1 Tax=Brettanomyces naardenensis TaxID=13370 RepID=A0A448YTS5_BRENA|nr:DEKNAAC105520 [Brettanomyces naardenensis]